MINFLISTLLLFASGVSYAQIQDVVPGKYTPGFYSVQNYIKNPNCFANTRNITASGTGTITRNTTNPLSGVADCSISGSASGDKITFSGRTFETVLKGQNCEMQFTYAGDASKWKTYAAISGTAVSQTLQLESTIDNAGAVQSKTASILFPCGDASSPVDIVFEATAAVPLTFKATKFQSGRATNISSISQARLVGTITWATTTSCAWILTSTSFANFPATAACPTPTVTGELQAPSTKIPGFILPRYGKGTYRIEASGDFFENTGNNVVGFRFSDGTTFSRGSNTITGQGATASQVGAPLISGVITNTTDQANATIQIQGAASSGSVAIDVTPVLKELSISVYYYPAGSEVVQTPDQRDTDWATCSFSTLAWQGLGTVTNNLQCKRQGGDLLMKGSATVSGVSAIAQIPLPVWGGLQLVTKGAPVIPALQVLGKGNRGASSTTTYFGGITFLASPSSSLLNIGCESSSSAGSQAATGSACLGNETFYMEPIRIPIEGWTANGMIAGSLADAVNSYGSSFGADFQSVYFGGDATCATACTTGTCTICNRVGTKITSVTYGGSIGRFFINGIDGNKYNCVSTGVNSNYTPGTQVRSASTSSSARVDYLENVYAAVHCFGKP